MKGKKFIFSIITLVLISSFSFGQNEMLKNIVNNLALYKQKKDLKFLNNAKKSVDSLLKVAPDTLDLAINVYKNVVNATILYADSLNKLNLQKDLFNQTISSVSKLSGRKQIYKYSSQLEYIKQCLANIYIRQAFVYLYKSDYLNASRIFQNAQNYSQTYKPLTAYLAYCNYKLGNFNTAGRLFNNLIETENTNPEYIETASSIYKSLGDTSIALEIIKKGRKQLPNDKSLLFDEANIYNNKRDYASLALLLPSLLDIFPDNADIAFIAANCYDHLNQSDKAITFYLKSIDLNNAAYEPVFNLGLVFLKKSEVNLQNNNTLDLMQARQWLEKANEIAPNDANCLLALQMVYTKTGNEEQLKNLNYKLKQINNQ